MYTEYDPVPTANPATDKLRVPDYHGVELYQNRENYYLLSRSFTISRQAVERAAQGAEQGFQVFILFEVEGSRLWADPQEIQGSNVNDDDCYVLSRDQWEILDPWMLDAINKKVTTPTTNKKSSGAKNLTDQVLEYVQAHPGTSNNMIAEGLGKKPNETSTPINMLLKQGLVRREKETDENRSGERVAYRYFPV